MIFVWTASDHADGLLRHLLLKLLRPEASGLLHATLSGTETRGKPEPCRMPIDTRNTVLELLTMPPWHTELCKDTADGSSTVVRYRFMQGQCGRFKHLGPL
eukprot:1159713-Pelagomonas_calceolata.AAC.9